MKIFSWLGICSFALSSFTSLAAHADAGQMVNLARPDKDQPVDNAFSLSGAKYTEALLAEVLIHRLPSVLSQMHPTTDDPTIRNVAMTVNGGNVAFNFQKHVAFFWSSVQIAGTTSIQSTHCPEATQTGLEVLLNTSGSTSGEAQGYVNGARILVCADRTPTGLAIQIERDLYAGPQYQGWIGLLMGDFLRTFGPALQASLQ